jgi:hypothetical protein
MYNSFHIGNTVSYAQHVNMQTLKYVLPINCALIMIIKHSFVKWEIIIIIVGLLSPIMIKNMTEDKLISNNLVECLPTANIL